MGKYIVSILLFGSCLSSVQSQNMLWGLYANVNGGRTNLMQFDDYAKAYNNLQKKELKDKLGKMRWSYGYSFGTTLIWGAANFEYQFENKYASTSAAFTDEARGTRHFAMRHTSHSFVLGFLPQEVSGSLITYGFVFGVDRIYIDSYKKYPSGEVTFGSENGTNGKYRGQNFTMGIKMDLDYPLYKGLFLNAGFKLTFSTPGKDIPLYLPNGFDGMTSITTSGTLHAGFKVFILNSGFDN